MKYLTFILSTLGLLLWAGNLSAQIIAQQDFNSLTAGTSTTDQLASGMQLTNSGSKNIGGPGLDFVSTWYDTRGEGSGPVTPSGDASDFIGVNSFAGASAPDVSASGAAVSSGVEQNFEFNDTDGAVVLNFEAVDVSGYTNRQLRLKYWINDVGYESDDAFTISLSNGGLGAVVLSYGETGLEANAESGEASPASWKSLTVDLDAFLTSSGLNPANLILSVTVDLNGSDENIFIDDVVFEAVAGCNITSLTANFLPCNDKNTADPGDDTFIADFTTQFTNPPATGNIELEVGGQIYSTSVAGLGTQFQFLGIPLSANGQPVVATIRFTATPSCSLAETVGVAPPPCSLPDCTPVINEIDYDNPNTDDREFVELYNPCNVPINLGDYQIVFINGSNGTPYVTQTLPSVMLMPGNFYVICGSISNVPNCDFQISPATNLIQNGAPDAVALTFAGAVVDAVSYEGSVTGYVEGSGSGLEDIAATGVGIGRYPDGADTDQNNVDFTQQCITPGAANSGVNAYCSIPNAYSVDVIGCNDMPTAEYDNQTNTFSVSSACNFFGSTPTADRGTFVNVFLCGNGDIFAKISSVLPNNGYAGIMMRESTAPGARMASIIRFPDGVKRIMYRASPNAPYGVQTLPFTLAFDYVRISRQGQYFLYYVSSSGLSNSWQLVFAQYTPMSGCIQAGIYVSSFADGAITLAEFNDVFVYNTVSPLLFDDTEVVEGVQGKLGGTQRVDIPQLPGVQEAPDFAVYPNPAVDELTIAFEKGDPQEVEIAIMSLEGRRYYRGLHQADGNIIRLPLGGLQMAEGMYLLTVQTGDAVVTKRFVKAGR
ncbi:MAG: lamin tail domain-containing protein [Lewinellaceae bacterium]|nr:lamin tail domain-containing protein [Lewinellaceae bacterium]